VRRVHTNEVNWFDPWLTSPIGGPDPAQPEQTFLQSSDVSGILPVASR
jgi:hypothetical protein